ncbi:MAG: DoxX family protein [Pseudolabrys sp.]|nr:DoxX family protein [Pseudolabrys sp.]
MPNILVRLLDAPWFLVFARVVVSFVFWGAGLGHLIDFKAGVAEMAMFGLPFPMAMNIFAAITLLVGSALVISNKYVWLGCGILATFTALTIVLVHRFWALPEPQATIAMHTATEHVSLIGALMILAILSRYTGGTGNGPRR